MYFSPSYSQTDRSNELRLVPWRPPRCIRVGAYRNLPWARTVAAMGREIMAPILLPSEVGQCSLAPRISRTDRSNELRLVPRPPTMYTRQGIRKLPWARTGSAHGARDNGSHTTYLVGEAVCF
jgi:hypothetical protein